MTTPIVRRNRLVVRVIALIVISLLVLVGTLVGTNWFSQSSHGTSDSARLRKNAAYVRRQLQMPTTHEIEVPVHSFYVTNEVGNHGKTATSIAIWCGGSRSGGGGVDVADRIVVTWLGETNRIVRVISGDATSGRKSTLPAAPNIQDMLDLPIELIQLPRGYIPCTRAPLYDEIEWLSTGALQVGQKRLTVRPIQKLVFESRLLLAPRVVPMWFYWEADSHELIVRAGMHGSP